MIPDRFRLAFCLLDTLRRCTPSNIRKALNELPKTLDEMYERVLQEIPEEKREDANRLFQCLVVAIRPLRAEELAELFAIEFDRDGGSSLKEAWRPVESPEDAVLSACSTLIAVVEIEGSKIVQFSHLSVKEYLTSDRLRTSEMKHYHIPLDAAHTILARACLTVLLQLDENVDKKRLKTFPLALYAAQNWVDHAKYEDVASRVQVAMEQLFNPSKPYLPAWIWIHDVDGFYDTDDLEEERPERPEATALYYAALCGFSALADYLIITHEENVHAKCGNRGSPLHAASYGGDLEVVRLLLAHGADINTTNRYECTPLSSVYDGGHLDVMRLLLKHGADVDARLDDTFKKCLLHEASLREDVDTARLLLQHNADVNSKDLLGCTPLHDASRTGKAGVALLLLEHGAYVNARDLMGNTPLCLASENGHLEVVELLLRHSADAQTLFGRSLETQTLRHLKRLEIMIGSLSDKQRRLGLQSGRERLADEQAPVYGRLAEMRFERLAETQRLLEHTEHLDMMVGSLSDTQIQLGHQSGCADTSRGFHSTQSDVDSESDSGVDSSS